MNSSDFFPNPPLGKKKMTTDIIKTKPDSCASHYISI